MKNQKRPVLFIVFMMSLVFFVSLVVNNYLEDSQPTYTQSDVSALMNFNASEFGCHKWSLQKDKEGLFIACWFNENNNSNCDSAGCWNVDKIFIYFPQFDGVSVVAEPERQECWNETKLITTGYWRFYDCLKNNTFALIGGNNDNVFWLNEAYERFKNEHLCIMADNKIKSENVTSCRTIPAVTKQINPWAVGENDLATEFCRVQVYDYILCADNWRHCKRVNGFKSNELDFCDDNYEACKNKVYYFERGEVMSANNKEIIRCFSYKDFYQKDFDVLGDK